MTTPCAIIAQWSWFIVLLVWLPGYFGRKKTLTAPILALQILNSALLAAGFVFALSPRLFGLGTQITPQTMLFGWLGVALNVTGIAFAIWARVTLAGNWSGIAATVKEQHELVQSGPYAIVRHPIYTGLLLALLGTVLAFGTLSSYAGFVAVIIAILIRVQIEERLMSRAFGAQHDAYRRSTKRLIPFLW